MQRISSIAGLPNAHKPLASLFNHKKKSSFFLPFIQSKLTINQPDNIYEQEANSIANKIMQMPLAEHGSTFFRPKSLPTVPLQRKENASADNPTVTTSVQGTLNSIGQPIETATRSFMESRFGYDFGKVQIHNDPLAHQSSAEINASAYTNTNHIVFGSGKYQPGTNAGRRLLAHELVHVIQQSSQGRNSSLNPVIQRTPDKETETTAPVLTPDFACDPQPVTHADFIAKSTQYKYNAEGSFGITVLLSNNVVVPQVQLDSKNNLMPTTTSINVLSFYIQKGEIFVDEKGITPANMAGSNCADDTLHYLITGDGADKIKEGEGEHCSDLHVAFQLSFLAYANEINKLAKKKTQFKNIDKAKESLAKNKAIKIHPDDWVSHFNCLTQKTKSRDKVYHKPPPVLEAVFYPSDSNCKYPLSRINAKTFPEIGNGMHLSEDIVQGCS